ncbi:MAG: hypothetical protein K5886_01720 [Lachnospiraceae bacterium]|nr:hypothetical protein [Lachnospiraceae bacterium]
MKMSAGIRQVTVLKKTVLFSIIHMLVDGLCAYAMASVLPGGCPVISIFIIYNFCAFVLQMPVGAVIDVLISRSGNTVLPLSLSIGGSVITLVGSFMLVFLPGPVLLQYLGVVILGIGNAVFHVGGGVGSVIEDHMNSRKGMNLGLFVAPGALGLYLGARFKTVSPVMVILLYMLFAGVIMVFLSKAYSNDKLIRKYRPDRSEFEGRDIILIISCFLVVALRSYIGFSVPMSWKTGMLLPLLAVLCVVLGKFGGGVLAAVFDVRAVIIVTLILSAVGYAFIDIPVIGLITLFLFNTTMPVTLYLLVNRFRDMPGLYFGLLTAAQFAGYLLSKYPMVSTDKNSLTGTFGCILSLGLLLAAAFVPGDSAFLKKRPDP